jgi:hypothetical protein
VLTKNKSSDSPGRKPRSSRSIHQKQCSRVVPPPKASRRPRGGQARNTQACNRSITSIEPQDPSRVHRDPAPDTLLKLFAVITPALLAGDVPHFGSEDWLELDPQDPRREHAMVRAALVWWTDTAFGEVAA